MTHDLLKNVLEALSAPLSAVQITELREGVFYADLVFSTGVRVSARPSDAIALAMRAGTTIYADESVLAEAGVELPEESGAEPEQETEVAKFREFLDQISPEDFETGS
jgi:bifunctional DNase/RNase